MGLKEKHNPSKIALENWNIGLWEKIIVLKWVIVSLEVNIFRTPRITVIDSSQWQVFVISNFWFIWGKAVQTPEGTEGGGGGGGFGYTQKRLQSFFLRWFFVGKFSEQAKVPPFKVVFHLANFFDLTNVSVQAILFPLTLVLRASLIFFDMESKRRACTMLILLLLNLQGTFGISLQWWLLIHSKFFSNFCNRKTPSYWQNLITILVLIFRHFLII